MLAHAHELKSNSSNVDMTMRPRMGATGALALFQFQLLYLGIVNLRFERGSINILMDHI
jgi:hypothetical protein